MNPSFEEYYECPTGVGQIENCKYVYNVGHTPDYFKTCASIYSSVNVPNTFYNSGPGVSYRTAHEGESYIGIANTLWSISDNTFSDREMVQMKLNTPLIAGNKYSFSFYAGARANTTIFSCFIKVGLCFINDSIVNPIAPLWQSMNADWVSNEYVTDTTGWQKLSGEYLANGGEKWIVIGVFDTNAIFDYITNGTTNTGRSYTYLDNFYTEEKIDLPPTPTITTYPATCNENGNAIITNYTSSNTYTFSPPGPTVDNNGVISGMTAETSYTVVAKDSSYNSYPSDTFSIEPQLPAPNPPTITSPQTFCKNSTASYLQSFSADYQWYSSNNSPVHESDTLLSGTYYVSQTVDGCESERAEVVVQINPTPNIIVSPDQAICKGASILLTASGAEAYSWSPGNVSGNTISVNPTVTTTYTVIGTSAKGCSDSASVTISILPTPTAAFSASDLTGAPPLQIDFGNSSSNADGFSWWVNYEFQSDDADFNYLFSNEGEYIVTLIAENEFCSDSVSKIIRVSLSFLGQIPNVFSPNNDGANDVWEIEGAVKSVVILNRWGNEVFSANESFNGWNGKDKSGNDCAEGVYFYRVENSNGDYFVGFVSLVK